MNKYRTNIYLDNETADNLKKIAGALHRSKNNTIVFLINNFIENERHNKKSFLKNWSNLDLHGSLDDIENIRDFIYDE